MYSFTAITQTNKLDKVKEADLEMTVYAKDSAAPAVYFNKYRENYPYHRATLFL